MENLIAITRYDGDGIGGRIDGPAYTILLLNDLQRLSPDTIQDMQRHLETSESFILIEGKAVLFVSEGENGPGKLEAYNLEKGVIYTVPQGIWHTQAMSRDAKILLVENRGTVAENSPRCQINADQKAFIMRMGQIVNE